jgi:hypothetical protein
MAMNCTRSILLIFALAAPSLASAETTSFEAAAALLGASCGNDIDTNCRGVNLDAGRLKDCLARNQDSVSPLCKVDSVKAFDAIQKRVAARAAVARMCEREIKKFCGAASNPAGSALECVLSMTQGVSAKCTHAIAEAGYR